MGAEVHSASTKRNHMASKTMLIFVSTVTYAVCTGSKSHAINMSVLQFIWIQLAFVLHSLQC